MPINRRQKIEITHDILARKVYGRIDADAKMKLKIEQFLKDRYQYYQETGDLLGKKDLAYVEPYLDRVEVSREQETFLHGSRQEVRRKDRRRLITIMAAISTLSLISIFAVFQWARAEVIKGDALEAKDAAVAARDSTAGALLLADSLRQEADSSAARLEVAFANLLVSDSLRRLSLEDALYQRDVANAATAEAIRKANEAKAAALAARARQVYTDGDHTLAFNLAMEALDLFPSEEVVETLHDIASNPNSRYYYRMFSSEEPIYAIQFSPNGKLVAAATRQPLERVWDERRGLAKIWQVSTGKLLHTFQVDFEMHDIHFSPDGKWISAIAYNQVHVWDVASGRTISSFENDATIRTVRFSPDGRFLLTHDELNIAKVWDTNGKLIHTLNPEIPVSEARFLPSGEYVVAIGADYKVHVYTTETGRIFRELDAEAEITRIRFSKNGPYMVSSGYNNAASVWVPERSRPLYSLPEASPVIDACFSPDNNLVATATFESTKIWSRNGVVIRNIDQEELVKKMWFSANGEVLFILSQTNLISEERSLSAWEVATGRRLLDFETKRQISNLIVSEDGQYVAYSEKVNNVEYKVLLWSTTQSALMPHLEGAETVTRTQFSPDERTFAVAEAGRDAHIFDSRSGEIVAKLPHNGKVYDVEYSPDGTLVVTASEDRTARLWKSDGTRLQEFKHNDWVNDADFSPNGKRVLTASNDGTAKVWDVDIGNEICSVSHAHMVEDAEYSPDGKYFATASFDKTSKIWDAQSGKLIHTLNHEKPVSYVRFSPDGTRMVTSSHDGARVWEVSSGQLLFAIQKETSMWGAAFSPDGKFMSTESGFNTVKITDARTGKRLHTLLHESLVYDISFSRDGKYLVAADDEGGPKLWDVKRGFLLMTLKGVDMVRTVDFSPSGQFIGTGGAAGLSISGSRAKVWLNPFYLWDNDQMYKLSKEE